MSALTLSLTVSGGWCALSLSDPTAEVRIQTHWLNDGFTDLSAAVLDLLSGRPSVSVRWPLEVSGGHFLDFALDSRGGVSVAISEFKYGIGADTVETIWSAERGKLVFSCHVTLSDLVSEYLRNLRRIRVLNVDVGGQIEQWRHLFPQSAYEQIEACAARRFGFKPATISEITGEGPGSQHC